MALARRAVRLTQTALSESDQAASAHRVVVRGALDAGQEPAKVERGGPETEEEEGTFGRGAIHLGGAEFALGMTDEGYFPKREAMSDARSLLDKHDQDDDEWEGC